MGRACGQRGSTGMLQSPLSIPHSTIYISLVSNEVPEHPCVSLSSNCVFERRLIEKYIAENGVDPVTNEVLTEDQLIDIKGIPQRLEH